MTEELKQKAERYALLHYGDKDENGELYVSP